MSYTMADFKNRNTFEARIKIFRNLTESEKICLLDEGYISKKEMYKFVTLLEDESEVTRKLKQLFQYAFLIY